MNNICTERDDIKLNVLDHAMQIIYFINSRISCIFMSEKYLNI